MRSSCYIPSRNKYAWGDLINPITGAASGAASGALVGGPAGAIVGGGIGLAQGILENNRLSKQRKNEQLMAYNQIMNNSQGVLATYPTNGVPQAGYGMSLNFGYFTHPNYYRGLRRNRRIGSCGTINLNPLFNQYYKHGGKLDWRFNPSDYPTNWAEGGELPTPTDGSQATQIASDMALYNGATHEQGGIDLDTNHDGQRDVELENNEVIKDDMVLSDRLYPSDHLKDHIRKLGVNIQESDTYASLAERLGKKKGNWESKLDSHLLGESTAANKMVEKYDNAIEMLFKDQQLQKDMAVRNNPTEMRRAENRVDIVDEKQHDTFKSGGWIQKAINPKHKGYCTPITKSTCTGHRRALALTFKKHHGFHKKADGGYIDEGPGDKNTQSQHPRTFIDAELRKNYPGKDLWALDFHNVPVRPGIPDTPAISALRRGYRPLETPSNVQDVNKMILDKTKSLAGRRFGGYYAEGGKFGNFLQDNYGNIASGIGFLGNQLYSNQLQTDFEPTLTPNPSFGYTDRTGYLTNFNQNQYRTMTQGLNYAAPQDNQALRSNLYARTLEGTNEAIDREQQRKDAYTQHFNQMMQYNNFFNTQQQNYARQLSLTNRNQRIGLNQANFSNLIHSAIGNKVMGESQDLDMVKSMLYSTMQGGTGVADRLDNLIGNRLPERLRRRYFGWYKPSVTKDSQSYTDTQ